MKKQYTTPKVEIDLYSLDASIANNCTTIVHNGPGDANHQQCDDYDDPFARNSRMARAIGPIQFYDDDACDCYYTSAEMGYWTS